MSHEQLAACPESRSGEHDLHGIDANPDPERDDVETHIAAKCRECGAVVRCDVDFDGFETEFVDEWVPERESEEMTKTGNAVCGWCSEVLEDAAEAFDHLTENHVSAEEARKEVEEFDWSVDSGGEQA